MQIKDSTFIVTGGCSGLGKATVLQLAKQEANIVIADLNDEAGTKLAEEHSNIEFYKTDITDEQDISDLLSHTSETFGSLHGAINCAGIGSATKLVTKRGPHTLETFEKIIKINLTGSFNVTRLVANHIFKQSQSYDQENGIIINTASVAAFDGQMGQVAYAASKGGVAAMTLPLARDLADYGIRVMTIAPGTFDTAMLAQLPKKYRLALEERTPFPKRLGNPHEYAILACHIIENEMLNGEVIRLDGALRMPPK